MASNSDDRYHLLTTAFTRICHNALKGVLSSYTAKDYEWSASSEERAFGWVVVIALQGDDSFIDKWRRNVDAYAKPGHIETSTLEDGTLQFIFLPEDSRK